MTLSRIFHININCTDFERSRTFYERLGFRVVLEFPQGEYPEIGRGLAVGRHVVKGALMGLGQAPNETLIDLLEWQSPECEPKTTMAAPTPGIARIAFRTNDVSAEFERLSAEGVEFLTTPIAVTGPSGQPGKFVCFRDPDGNLLELIEVRE